MDFCKLQNIECDGERNPWCPLEEKIENNTLPPLAFKQLKQQQVIRILLEINRKQFENKKQKMKFFVGEKITCPFFRIDMEECDFLICPYNSLRVDKTNCILSVNKELTIAEIAIAKDIPKTTITKMLYDNKDIWEKFENYLAEGFTKIATCKKCGQFKKICYYDKPSCMRRQKQVSVITNSNIIPKRFFKYPIILVLLVAKKIFGDYCYHIYPQSIWNLYTAQLNSVIGD